MNATATKLEKQIKRMEKAAPLSMTMQAERAIRIQIAKLRAELRALKSKFAAVQVTP